VSHSEGGSGSGILSDSPQGNISFVLVKRLRSLSGYGWRGIDGVVVVTGTGYWLVSSIA